MVEFNWIQMSLFVILVLQFTAAATGQFLLYLTVRVGDEVTLPCGNVIDGQQQCDSTTWIFAGSGRKAAVELIQLGQIGENARAKSNRLSVTEKCSLVIKKVTVDDAGRYTCRQLKSGRKRVPDADVVLSVVTMTEDEDDDKVTLTCSVSTYERCGDTVKWLFNGRDVDKDNRDLKTSQSPCRASVAFLTYNYIYTSRYDFFTCEVTDGNRVKKFPFRLQPSGEKPGEDTTTTTTTEPTTEPTTTTTTTEPTTTTTEPTTTAKSTTTEISMKAGKTTTASTINEASTEPQSASGL
ncbi:uncharacterized protein [Enoplosus armatus]|uniref:uncharacterized protein n=1 Tax=Enoplosus armatus TaxID=215367 RepID=UPI0039953522